MRPNLSRVLVWICIPLIAVILASGCTTKAVGQIQYWSMQDGQRLSTGFPNFLLDGAWTFPNVRLADVGDMDNDGFDDIVWQYRDGLVQYWKMRDGQHLRGVIVGEPVPEDWTLAGVGDVDGDGDDDIVWHHRSGQVRYWEIKYGHHLRGMNVDKPVSKDWTLAGVGDVDGDGDDDIVWQDHYGQVRYWEMEDGYHLSGVNVGAPVSEGTLAGVGDVDGDGDDDIVWQDHDGQVHYWEIEDGQQINDAKVGNPVPDDWMLAGIGDMNGDGTADIVWQHRDSITEYGTLRATDFKEYRDKGEKKDAYWHMMQGSLGAPIDSADNLRFEAYTHGIFGIPFDYVNSITTAGLFRFDFPVPEVSAVVEWRAIVDIFLPYGVKLDEEDDQIWIDLILREQPRSTSFPETLRDFELDERITDRTIYYYYGMWDDDSTRHLGQSRKERFVLSGEFVVGSGESSSVIIGPSFVAWSPKSSGWASIGAWGDFKDDGFFYFNGLDYDCLYDSFCRNVGMKIYYTMRPVIVHHGPFP